MGRWRHMTKYIVVTTPGADYDRFREMFMAATDPERVADGFENFVKGAQADAEQRLDELRQEIWSRNENGPGRD